jgi:monoamine oxidase
MTDGSLRLARDAESDLPSGNTLSWNLPNIPVLPGDEDLRGYLKRAGYNDAQLDEVRRSFANAVGESMQYISAEAAFDEINDTSNGEGNFRILDGYSRLTVYLAEGLDIRLNTIVEWVDWSGRDVKVYTDKGLFEAEQVVITLPVGVLQSGAITFTPALPPEKQGAIAHLRMGPVIKLVYRFDEPIASREIMVIFGLGNPPIWWSPSFGQDTDQYVWTAFVSGDGARELLALGEEDALEKALDSLRQELNCPALKAVNRYLVNWPADPFTRGGYSIVSPGHLSARMILSQPVAGKLFWAGEATATGSGAATVHGAYASGRRAASEIFANGHQQ